MMSNGLKIARYSQACGVVGSFGLSSVKLAKHLPALLRIHINKSISKSTTPAQVPLFAAQLSQSCLCCAQGGARLVPSGGVGPSQGLSTETKAPCVCGRCFLLHRNTVPSSVWFGFNPVWVDSREIGVMSELLQFCLVGRSVTWEGAWVLDGGNVHGLRLLTLLSLNPVSPCQMARQEEG